jgi:hypothetical protein
MKTVIARPVLLSFFITLQALCPLTAGQGLPRNLQEAEHDFFRIPDGKIESLSQNFLKGVALPIVWLPWLDETYVNASATRFHLWVTAFDFNQYDYAKILLRMFPVLIYNIASSAYLS